MNRQVWTNAKQYLSRGGELEGDPSDDDCPICGEIENTMHLLFECQVYSEKIWKALSDGINGMLNLAGTEKISLHAYNILYNMDISKLNNIHNDQILYLVQEIKCNMVYRRYIRCTRGKKIIRFNNTRILAHIMLVLKKTIYQNDLEGGDAAFLFNLLEYYSMNI